MENEEYYKIYSDPDEVLKIKKLLEIHLSQAKVKTIDALTAVCEMSIEFAYNGGVSKPKFLGQLSNWWEELDVKATEKK